MLQLRKVCGMEAGNLTNSLTPNSPPHPTIKPLVARKRRAQ
jgi:hypothetical protein